MKCQNGLAAYLIVLAASFFFVSTHAQGLHKPLRTITTKDGLPQSFVSGLLQDKAGFIWIGTRNGLARYDGLHFKVFQHKNGDAGTLHSNLIVAMKMDKHNRIWIQYDEPGSIDCFDPVAEHVEHISERTLYRLNKSFFPRNGWMPDSDGNFWYATYVTGVRLCNWKQNKVSYFRAAGRHLLDDTICGILEDAQNQLWVLSNRGVSRYEPVNRRFKHFPFPFRPLFWLANDNFTSFHQRLNGELMFGDKQELIFFNPVTATFRTVAFEHNNASLQYVQTGPDGADYFQSGKSIFRYDDAHGVVQVVKTDTFSPLDAQSFLVDRSGLLWLGLNAAGICQVDLNAPAFEVHPTARTFHYDLLKQEFGLELDKLYGYVPANMKNFIGTSYDFRSAYDQQHRLYIALSNRLVYFDPVQRKWISLPKLPEPPKKPGNHFPGEKQSICFARDGRLWAVNDNHFIGYFDTTGRQWVAYLDSAEVHSIETLEALLDVAADPDRLWITTEAGLLSVDLFTRQIIRLDNKTRPGMLPTNYLLGLKQDPSRPDILWIGSSEGLICLNKKNLTTTVFTTQQGLPDNTIYSIQTDAAGFLWLSTNQGLCRFHPVTHQLRNFKAEDGLPGNEFNRFHHLKLPDGRLAFGGVDGWVLFNPNSIRPDTFQPGVAFTRLLIYNKPVEYALSNPLLPEPLNVIKKLVLPYDQNTLTFDFAGLQYNQPGELHYRYRLESFDDKWITTDNPVAGYTQLPPGRYTLHINCTNTIGQWSAHVRSLSITVLPPWWRTWQAYALYVLAFAGVAYTLYRNWLQREKARQQIILQQKETAQLKAVDEMKSRFFANITHEFRTPLSLIIAPLEEMNETDAPPGWKSNITGIKRNARQLLQLINQLLDMAKLEAGSMNVALFRGDPERFVQDVLAPFYAAAAAKNIRLSLDASGPVTDEYLFDADKLHTILSNLLSNAVKFTLSGGNITVTITHENEGKDAAAFCFQVRDSGIGIAPEQLPFIFNRFYQADDSSTRSYGGTGIGLALAKELTELMKGSLTASSIPRQGTVFTLKLSFPTEAGNNVPAYGSIPGRHDAFVPAAPAGETEADGEDGSKPLILVVEDNLELNAFLAQAFRQHYRVLTAVDGAQGWQIAQEKLPDVIVGDWMMPGIDGNALCQAVKSNLATGHIAFIMLTAKAAPASRIEGLQNQADDYIIKPFITEELQLRVANLLERQRRVREKLWAELSKPGSADEKHAANESAAADDPFLKAIHALIENNLDETAFGVEDLAAGMYMSRASLHRKVKAVTDLTPTLLIRNYRLKRAARFLKEGANSSEAAYRSGFDSPAYFTKCFREFYAVTPGEFTRQAS